MTKTEIKLYLTEIEAAIRYGFSRAWFQRSRWAGDGPSFIKVRSKVLYPLEATDKWFADHGLRSSTSEEKTHA